MWDNGMSNVRLHKATGTRTPRRKHRPANGLLQTASETWEPSDLVFFVQLEKGGFLAEPLPVDRRFQSSEGHRDVKPKIILIALVAAATTLIGCKALLGTKASPNSPAVILGAATTNDALAVADLKLVRDGNAQFNATPTEQPLNTLFNALIPLVSAMAGFYTRHAMPSASVTIASSNSTAQKT